MLSHNLIHSLEDHSEEILTAVIQQLRQGPELKHIAALPASELTHWGGNILKNLGHWLTSREEGLGRDYEALGKLRFEESVPLAECVLALLVLKHAMVDFARGRGFAISSIEIYAEEELEFRVDRFFDDLAYHLVKGYEKALRKAAHLDSMKEEKKGPEKPARHWDNWEPQFM